jgi:SAM-dependent methyltransferase
MSPTNTRPGLRACKICGQSAPLFGVVDFNKSCEEHRGKKLPLSGNPIYYNRCAACAFLFTDFFDQWRDDEFLEHIYNADYVLVDPDYISIRPLGNAQFIFNLFGPQKTTLSLLDFGGGNGQLAASLTNAGFSIAHTYDPFTQHAAPPPQKYNIISCFETLEHTPDPVKTAKEIASHLDDAGIILFSTLTQPTDFDTLGLAWWYVGPRNGHVSIHSRQSLAHLWKSIGFTVISHSANVHFAFRNWPKFVENVIVLK